MKFITGDENGLLKITTFEPKTDPKAKEYPPAKTKSYGKIDKNMNILTLEWPIYSEGGSREHVVIGRLNGKIQLVSVKNGVVLSEYEGFGDEKVANETLIGVYQFDGLLVSCTSHGLVKYTHLGNGLPTHGVEPQIVSLGQDSLTRMRIHPTDPKIFATGGKERELCVWNILTGATKVEDEEYEHDPLPSKAHLKVDRIKPEWKARNVKNDELDMRVPVWITDIQWRNNSLDQLVITTGYGQIRVYDRPKQKRPIINHKYGEYPLKNFTLDGNDIYVADTVANLTAMDLETAFVKGRCKEIAGAVTQTKIVKDYTVCVSLDRFLRVYEGSGKRTCIQKTYLKQRLNCLLVDDADVEKEESEESKKRQMEAEELDDIWEGIPTVGEGEKASVKVKKQKTKAASSSEGKVKAAKIAEASKLKKKASGESNPSKTAPTSKKIKKSKPKSD